MLASGNEAVPFEGPSIGERDCWASAWLLETAGRGRRAASTPHASLSIGVPDCPLLHCVPSCPGPRGYWVLGKLKLTWSFLGLQAWGRRAGHLLLSLWRGRRRGEPSGPRRRKTFSLWTGPGPSTYSWRRWVPFLLGL